MNESQRRLEEIASVIASIRTSGHKEQIVLVHPTVDVEIRLHSLFALDNIGQITTIYGCDYIVTSRVKDFIVVDDRSWVDQKW